MTTREPPPEQDFIFVLTAVSYRQVADAAFLRQMTVASFASEALRRLIEETNQKLGQVPALSNGGK